jgi:hypothetical protein
MGNNRGGNMKFHYKTGVLITTLAIIFLLAGCGDDQVGNASEILKKRLKSPSSFSLVSGKTVWSGKTNHGQPAFIVRIEYDAQNGFGAAIWDCNMVAYWDKGGDSISYLTPGAIQDCEVKGVMSEEEIIKMQVDYNFNR